MTADVVAGFVGNNTVAVTDLQNLIKTVNAALFGAEAPVLETAEQTVKRTAGQIHKSVTPDALISFMDGKPYKTLNKILKRHLTTHRMTIVEYKARFGFRNDYPTMAPAYNAARWLRRLVLAKALASGVMARTTLRHEVSGVVTRTNRLTGHSRCPWTRYQIGMAVVYLTWLSAKWEAEVATFGCLSNSRIRNRS